MINDSQYIAMFISCILAGFLSGFLFDICRALRVGFKLKRLVPALDVLFWIGVLCLTYAILYTCGNGRIRGFCILGILGGFVLYMLCFSKVLVKWMVVSVRAVNNFFKVFFAPFSKVFCFLNAKIGVIVQIIQKKANIFGRKTLENSEKIV